MTTGVPLEKGCTICSSAGSRADSRCSRPRDARPQTSPPNLVLGVPLLIPALE